MCGFVLAISLVAVAPAEADRIQELEERLDNITREYEQKIRELQEEISTIKTKGEGTIDSSHEPSAIISWEPNLGISSADGKNALNISGRVQPMFEYEKRRDRGLSDHSSFFVRRARLDVRGHALSRELTFRIMPELSREANLRDAWVNYRFSPLLELRAGQYQVPFHWERDSSSNRHQFLERSVAGREFQWADGRDIGLMFHGIGMNSRVRYNWGVFSGQGRNKRRSEASGVVITARSSVAFFGDYPSSEALVEAVSRTNIAAGLGVYYAANNNVRDWHSWSGTVREAADVVGATVDLHCQRGRFSGNLSGFYRWVDTAETSLAAYSGTGFTAQTGFLILPEKVFSSVRYSQAHPNQTQSAGREREVLMDVQYFIDGHNSKIALELGRTSEYVQGNWKDKDLIRAQYQMLF